ncbi:MAG: hypothetical protein ABII12_11720 [Planctomycetota bacterium]
MSRTTHNLTVSFAVILLAAGCKEEAPPPAPQNLDQPVREIDFKHAAQVRGDQRLTIPNLQFVIQRDRAQPDRVGVTLFSTDSVSGSARMLFGSLERMAPDEQLKGRDIRFGGARFLNVHGNGIFARTTAYQPKFVVLRVRELTDDEVNGAITGEFYRFNTALPTAKPRVVKLDVAFAARLHVK